MSGPAPRGVVPEGRTALPAVGMTGIVKSFGGVHALRGVDFSVEAGTVHALMGENGAGKSTLLKIMQGVHAPTSGEVAIHGTAMTEFTPEAARALGVGMIFQELSLIPALTVAQNIFLGREPRRAGGLLVDDRAADARAKGLMEQLGLDIDPRTPVSRLSTGQMQMTEIAKAVSQDARVLILDEPTSALSTAEVDHLFAFLRRITAGGVAAIYVSHRMDEIYEVAQHVTVLRDGRRVITAPLADLTIDGIVEHMVGKRVHGFSWVPRDVDRTGQPVLELVGVSGRHKPRDVSLALHRGEILGIAGLLGSGRSELARLVFGIDPLVSGEIQVNGRAVSISSPAEAIRAGIALIPESRAREGLVTAHTVEANLSLPRIDALAKGPFLDRKRETASARDMSGRLRVKAPSVDVPVRTLSGGNQQKVVLGKWIATEPDVIVLDEPTAGVDIGSKGEIVEIIRALADEGKAVIIISSELAEVLACSDRILVMSDGRIGREVSGAEIARLTEAGRGEPGEDGAQIARAEQGLQIMIQEVRINAARN